MSTVFNKIKVKNVKITLKCAYFRSVFTDFTFYD